MAVHEWRVTPGEARSLQEALRSRRVPYDSFPELTHVGGVDLAYCPGSTMACCVIAVLTYPVLALAAVSKAWGAIDFPYIPGLLTFREGPLVEQAFGRLDLMPQVLLFYGHGISHPRRMGIATHLGIVLDHASVGCAKKPLTGTFEDPGPLRGSTSRIMSAGEIVGCALRTQAQVKPVFVSEGNRVSLGTAVQICLTCAPRYRIPEPLRYAHNLARQEVVSACARS